MSMDGLIDMWSCPSAEAWSCRWSPRLSRVWRAVSSVGPPPGAAASSSGSTVTAMRTWVPNWLPSASSSRVRSRPSSWLRVNSSATAMMAVCSCSVTGRLAVSQARWFGGRSAIRVRQTEPRSAAGVLLGLPLSAVLSST